MGLCSSRSPSPTVAITLSYHSWSGLRPAMDSGSRMFSSAVSVGTRLNDWKTKPISSRRSRVSALSLSRVRSCSPMNTEPESAVSSAAQQCISVDLPEPLGPITAVNSPGGEVERHVVERGHQGLPGAVGLGQVADARRGRRRRGPRSCGPRVVETGATRMSWPSTGYRCRTCTSSAPHRDPARRDGLRLPRRLHAHQRVGPRHRRDRRESRGRRGRHDVRQHARSSWAAGPSSPTRRSPTSARAGCSSAAQQDRHGHRHDDLHPPATAPAPRSTTAPTSTSAGSVNLVAPLLLKRKLDKLADETVEQLRGRCLQISPEVIEHLFD